MTKFLRFLLPCVLLLRATPARAQLFESVGIRAQGLGGAFVAVADDANAAWWNGAGLATGAYFDALVEYDRSRQYGSSVKAAAVGFPALGLSYYRLPINQMRPAGPTGTGDLNREDQGVLGVYGLTAGQAIGSHLVVASTLKLERANDTHGDLDVGVMARAGSMRLGLTVKNVRKPTLETNAGSLPLDRQARVGIAFVGATRGLISNVTLAVDADLTETATAGGDVRHVGGGAEFWTFGKRLGARIGGSANTVGERGASASGGVSVAVASGSYVKTYVDAQLTGGSDTSRRGWGFDLRATF